ncbi:MAG: dienelactone hydrolase family protein [Dehalococcoidia bacterium]
MNEVQRYLIEEFVEDYRQRTLSRRDLLRRAVLIMGGGAAAAAALRSAESTLAAASPGAIRAGVRTGAQAQTGDPARGAHTAPPLQQTDAPVVDPADPSVITSVVSFAGEAGDVRGYLARPAGEGAFPGVVVIHENRGLIEPNLDIARRYAKEGYVALAPDLLSRVGGTDHFAADPAQATGAIGQLGPDAPASDGNAAVAFLQQQPYVSGAIGATGFCYGGGVVWLMGVRNPALLAIVPHYGMNPPLEEVPNLRAAALGIYAENDTRITGASDVLAAALMQAGAIWEFWIAPGANHAFFNNTGMSYNPQDAREAWNRALIWFDQNLR